MKFLEYICFVFVNFKFMCASSSGHENAPADLTNEPSKIDEMRIISPSPALHGSSVSKEGENEEGEVADNKPEADLPGVPAAEVLTRDSEAGQSKSEVDNTLKSQAEKETGGETNPSNKIVEQLNKNAVEKSPSNPEIKESDSKAGDTSPNSKVWTE